MHTPGCETLSLVGGPDRFTCNEICPFSTPSILAASGMSSSDMSPQIKHRCQGNYVRLVVLLGAGDRLERVKLLERLADDFNRFVNVLFGDDEGRGKSNDVFVGRFRQ